MEHFDSDFDCRDLFITAGRQQYYFLPRLSRELEGRPAPTAGILLQPVWTVFSSLLTGRPSDLIFLQVRLHSRVVGWWWCYL